MVLNTSRGLPATLVVLTLFILRIHNSKAFNAGAGGLPGPRPQARAPAGTHAALGYYSQLIKVPAEELSSNKKHLEAARPLHLARKAIGTYK